MMGEKVYYRIYFALFAVYCVMGGGSQVYASYTLQDGKLLKTEELATLSVQEHFSLIKDFFDKQEWDGVIRQARIILRNFPGSAFAADSYFYLGAAYFHKQEWDVANEHLSCYLKSQSAPRFFEETFMFKFQIAKHFETGAKKRLLGKESLPKLFSARREAIDLYDEVIEALPQNDLAVQSLFGKGKILFMEEDFKESIETYQTLLRRFPKHPLALDSYLAIIEVYRTQGDKDYPDPDYLDLAEIQLQKCKGDFPDDPRIVQAENLLTEMKEIYARDLLETAQFYEKTKKPGASRLYYTKIVSRYPSTKSASTARGRLEILGGVESRKKVPHAEQGILVETTGDSSLEPVR